MAVFAESFNAPDAALQAAATDLTWAYVTGSSNGWWTVSNQASPNGTSRGITNYDRAEHDTDTSDQYGQFVVHAIVPGTDCQGGPCVRFQAAANTSYMAAVNAGDGSPTITIIKTVAGVRTSIGSPVSVDITGLPKVLRIEVSGDTLTAYWDGAQVAQETDTDIPTGTRGGLYGHEDSGQGLGFIVDNFEFGDLGAGGDTTTADPLAVDVSLGTPSAVAHRSVGAGQLEVEVSFGTPAVVVARSTEAEAFAVDLSLGTPAASGGSQTAADPLAVEVAFGVPAVAAAYSTTAEPLAVDLAYGTPVVAGAAPVVDLHFIALAPELGHGEALAPEVTERTALAPELAHAGAGTPEVTARSVAPPELGHGAADPPETAHGQPEVEVGHGNPGEPEL